MASGLLISFTIDAMLKPATEVSLLTTAPLRPVVFTETEPRKSTLLCCVVVEPVPTSVMTVPYMLIAYTVFALRPTLFTGM